MTTRSSILALFICVASCLPIQRSHAQDAAAEQEALFLQMTARPQDLAATFAYVKVATDRGDYEAAIGALERVLFYQPDLPRVKYELGSLYFRLGSYEMAKRYFKDALASPDVDPRTRALIETSMPDAEKQLQSSRFSGFLETGLRYQSNASFSPAGDTIRLGGQDLSLLSTATRKADGNAFEFVGLSHDYDLGDQRGDTIETRFVGYGTQQFRLTNLDVGLLDLSVGPRLALAPELLPSVSIKPYIVGGTIFLGGVDYLSSGGAGLSAGVPVGTKTSFEPFFEYRRVEVSTGVDIPVSTLNSGNDYTAGLAVYRQLNQNMSVSARGFYQRGDAFTSFNAYNQYAGEISVSFAFAPLLGTKTRNWTLTPFARIVLTDFAAPNPFFDPAITRHDNEQVAGLLFDAPITKDFGVRATAQCDHVGSTLANFRQNNVSAMLGPTARF